MNKQELLKFASEEQPELFEKTCELLKEVEKSAPDFLDDVISDFDLITNTTLEKMAQSALAPHALSRVGTVAALGAAGALGSALLTDLYDAAKRGLTKGVNFDRIMESNPQLKQVDKKTLRNAYNTLHRFAPDFSSDPMLAGAVLEQLSVHPLDTPRIMNDLISSRKSLQEAKGKFFQFRGLGEAALSRQEKEKEKK